MNRPSLTKDRLGFLRTKCCKLKNPSSSNCSKSPRRYLYEYICTSTRSWAGIYVSVAAPPLFRWRAFNSFITFGKAGWAVWGETVVHDDNSHIDQPCCTGWHGQGTSQLLGFHFLILSGSCCQMKTGTFSSPEFYTHSMLWKKCTSTSHW